MIHSLRHFRSSQLIASLLLIVFLTACGAATDSASIEITSPTDNQIINGSNVISVDARLSNATDDATLTAEHNGTAITPNRSGNSVTLSINLTTGSNTIQLTVANQDQAVPSQDTIKVIYQPDATVTIDSHADGEVITGTRAVTVTATLANAMDAIDIEVLHVGTAITPVIAGNTVSVDLVLADHANTLFINVRNPGQLVRQTASITVNYPFISLTTGQAASIVIGQADS